MDLLNLNKNYTINDLKKAMKNKIDEINSYQINEIDKNILIRKYYNIYEILKQNKKNELLFSDVPHIGQAILGDAGILLHPHQREGSWLPSHQREGSWNLLKTPSIFDIDLYKNNSYSSYSTYSSILDKNGDQIVNEYHKEFKNGKKHEESKNYKIKKEDIGLKPKYKLLKK